MTLAAIYLYVGALITVGFGVAYLVATRQMARMVGIAIESAGARADYRAIYAGSQIAIGVFFAIAAHVQPWRAPGVVALSLYACGFGIARLGSLAADGVKRHPQWIVGALELLAGLVGVWMVLAAG